MRRTIPAIAIALTSVLLLSQFSNAQTASNQVVKLSAIVTDKKKNPVNELKASELLVKEGGKELKVLGIQVDERPLDLAIMIDTSGSMRSQFADEKDVVVRLVKFKRPEDKVFIGRFTASDRIEAISEFTSDESLLLNPLRTLNIIAGQSAVIDALHFGVMQIIKFNNGNVARRKVMVVITDGEDRNSLHKLQEVTNLIREEGVQVFVVGLTQELARDGSLIRATPQDRAEKLLTTIADESGGRVLLPKNKEEFALATTDIINHLRGQFLINVELTNAIPGFHKIGVKHNEHRVIVPRGYFVKKDTESP